MALSKGRLYQETLPLLREAGIRLRGDTEASRKLIFDTESGDLRVLLIRAQDVPTYVQYGAADLGVAGKDVLLEHGGDGLYEPLDLDVSRCRMMVAGRPGGSAKRGRLRVATKYVNTAREHFAAKGMQVEIIALYGSMELAPLVGLADHIVDLVDTGRTLAENGLEPLEHVTDISARLIANRASMKMKHEEVRGFIEAMTRVVDRRRHRSAGAGRDPN